MMCGALCSNHAIASCGAVIKSRTKSSPRNSQCGDLIDCERGRKRGTGRDRLFSDNGGCKLWSSKFGSGREAKNKLGAWCNTSSVTRAASRNPVGWATVTSSSARSAWVAAKAASHLKIKFGGVLIEIINFGKPCGLSIENKLCVCRNLPECEEKKIY